MKLKIIIGYHICKSCALKLAFCFNVELMYVWTGFRSILKQYAKFTRTLSTALTPCCSRNLVVRRPEELMPFRRISKPVPSTSSSSPTCGSSSSSLSSKITAPFVSLERGWSSSGVSVYELSWQTLNLLSSLLFLYVANIYYLPSDSSKPAQRIS